MNSLISKWIVLPLLMILVALSVLYLMGKKSVHHEVLIAATPEQVWDVLTDTKAYPDWNTVMRKAHGVLEEGQKVTYTFQQDAENQMEIIAIVKQIVSNRLLNQVGGIPWLITFDHRYELTKEGSGTRLTIHEEYRGIYVPFWNPEPVRAAYQRLAEALQTRAMR